MNEDAEVSKIEHFQGAAEVTDEAITLCETLYDYPDDKVVRVVKKMGLKLEGVHGWLEDVATGRDANGKLEADLLEIRSKLHMVLHPLTQIARGGTYNEDNGGFSPRDVVSLECLTREAYEKVDKLYQMR